ncbi:RRM motif-containing protein [Phaffia rhodozyma]|uniref:RRM motif-containing protein n=1 Tax=Phaffia rhodozyma TaxID=264483 RepID=A0A0F7SRT3_PHARH|nr:RRM motif-containing protein [Phaffia rhodozyma]
MDIDMSLDDLASKNKKTSNTSARGGPARRDRTVSGRGGAGRGADRAAGSAPYTRPPPASTDAPWRHDMFGGKGGRQGGQIGSDSQTNPSAKLKIEGLHYEIQNFQLEKIFAQAGKIAEGPSIVYDRSGRSTGVAYVTYAAISDAKLAFEKLDGQKANGEPIKITYAPVRLPRPGTVRATGPAEGKPLFGRLGGLVGGTDAPAATRGRESRGPRTANPKGTDGPSAPRVGGAGRGGREARGGRGGGGGGGGGRGKGSKRGPVNQDALDKELEAFMKSDAPATASAPAPAAEANAMEE